MALDANQLTKIDNLRSVAGAAESRQLFHYEAGGDAVATVVAAGYFNGVRGILNVGDRIHVVAATETAFRVLKVTAVPATGDVTTAALAFS